ncbi:hypothetical protein INT48_005791 [Thamnidium elegans]|uniref:Uncharacterized protein n=1 Tax=Thamnidium elegans TaxID=101142 RepID=A0A8H7SW00_9FUNG|nr:hypothetical protein INT48_005791 [Thamnidium elegans]
MYTPRGPKDLRRGPKKTDFRKLGLSSYNAKAISELLAIYPEYDNMNILYCNLAASSESRDTENEEVPPKRHTSTNTFRVAKQRKISKTTTIIADLEKLRTGRWNSWRSNFAGRSLSRGRMNEERRLNSKRFENGSRAKDEYDENISKRL